VSRAAGVAWLAGRIAAWRSISSGACSRASAQAHTALEQGDHAAAANDAWRRYTLIEDALRDQQDLLDEGVALSKVAIDLWLQR
jgi:hypothetical protein